MSSPKITTVERLQDYLHHAMQIEHATIPPYLLAMYSIKPGTNLDATQIIRVVVVEEMLHLTLAANLLNAVGGRPDLTAPGFVPVYPASLPDGETDFQVDLQPFSRAAIKTFLKIERPGKAPEGKALVHRQRSAASALGISPGETDIHYYSIGEFYDAITNGLKYLHEQMGDKLFTGTDDKQVGPEYYYSGGGKLFKVKDLDTALGAVDLIIEQGEGFGGGIYNDAGEIAHNYRYQELLLERHYQKGDCPCEPTGPEFEVQWDAVYQFKKNPRLTDYTKSSELYNAAVSFNQTYANFLALLTLAYNGQPNLLLEKAVPEMFVLRNKVNQLIHNPIPGMEGVYAAPTFEMAVGAAVTA
jgi:hypothetical protein